MHIIQNTGSINWNVQCSGCDCVLSFVSGQQPSFTVVTINYALTTTYPLIHSPSTRLHSPIMPPTGLKCYQVEVWIHSNAFIRLLVLT